MKNRRETFRHPLIVEVKLSHPSFGDIYTFTTNISNGGVMLKSDGIKLPPLNSIMEIQVVNEERDMPIKKVKLVRILDRRIGLSFCCHESHRKKTKSLETTPS